ncbi:MAG: hypothetical protein AB1486_23120 [Planctomycetota bacterium]
MTGKPGTGKHEIRRFGERLQNTRTVSMAGLVVAIALSLAGQVAATESEQWLRYRWSRDTYQADAAAIGQYVELKTMNAAASDSWGLSLQKGETLLVGHWPTPMAKEGFITFAVVRSPKRDRLFADSNEDGRLLDEKPTEALYQSPDRSEFGPLKLLFSGDDGPITYHVNVDFYKWSGAEQLNLSAAGWYEGEVSIGGKKLRCLLVDYNSNGAFNDTSMNFAALDHIKLGTGKDLETHFFGQYLAIDDVLYHPEPARDGSCIEFTRVDRVACGTLKVPEGVREVSIAGENGYLRFDLIRRDAEAAGPSVPAGRWRLNNWIIERKDANGKSWTMEGRGFSDRGLLRVDEGFATALDIAEPVTARLEVTKRSGGYSFNGSLKGRYGESINILKEGRRPKPPVLRIKSHDGAYELVKSFEYG